MADLSDFTAPSLKVKRGDIPAEQRRKLNGALKDLNPDFYGADIGQVSGGGNDTPTAGLVSYWPLDDLGDGTATDYVGRNDGTVTGSVSTVTGKIDDAAAFGGGYIEVGTGETVGLSEFTVSARAGAEDEDASRLRTILARQNPTGKSYENVAFVDNEFEGLDIQDPAEDLAVRDCLTENNGDNGIEGEDITNAVVSDCTISPNDGEGIDFDAGGSLVIDRCTIRNNDAGVEFDGDAADLTVTNSTIASNDSDGLSANNVNNETIRNCLITDNDTEGIDIDGGNNLTIGQCTVRNNDGNGIEFDFTDVGNLTITESVVDNSGDSGVFFDDGEVTNASIKRSNITNSGNFGVEIGPGATVSGLSVVDSYLNGNTDGGVESGSSITTTELRSKLVSKAGVNSS